MIEKMFTQFNTPEALLNAMRETLKTIHPQYEREISSYKEGLYVLREALDEYQLKLLDAAIEEDERNLASHLFYLFWKGVQQNYACYKNPVNRYFLKMDFEEFHQESLMTAYFPNKYDDAGRTFVMSLPENLRVLTDPIYSYYAYWQTTGYKLAHYYGFIYADSFLPQIIPGYHPDLVATITYNAILCDYFSLPYLTSKEIKTFSREHSLSEDNEQPLHMQSRRNQ